MQDDPGDMQEHHEKKKHHPQHGRCRPRQKFDKDTDGRGKERHTHKVRPEQPSRHPRRHQSGHESTIQKVLNPENNQGNGHKNSYKLLARFTGGEDWCRVHAVAATPSSLQELAPLQRSISTLSPHSSPRPLWAPMLVPVRPGLGCCSARDRKSTRLNSSHLTQSRMP